MAAGSDQNNHLFRQQQQMLNLRGAQMVEEQTGRTAADGLVKAKGTKKQLIGTIVGVLAAALFLVFLAHLSGCGPKERDAGIAAVYGSRSLSLSGTVPASMYYELAGNGKQAVILPCSNNGEDGAANITGGSSLCGLRVSDGTLRSEGNWDLPEGSHLLGMDPAGNVWLTAERGSKIYRLDPETGTLGGMDPGVQIARNGVFGFGTDGGAAWFLVETTAGEHRVLALAPEQVGTGQILFDQNLETWCQGTVGYLPREADWAEELEGREEDLLLSMLFPEGPQDSLCFVTTRWGDLKLALIRKSPIDAESWCILCGIRSDFTLEPELCYEMDTEAGFSYGMPVPATAAPYDLLIPRKDGLYGLLPGGAQEPLADWEDLGTSALWFTKEGLMGCEFCPGTDGSLWLLTMDGDEQVLRALGPLEGEK